jgi:hypothetical protein
LLVKAGLEDVLVAFLVDVLDFFKDEEELLFLVTTTTAGFLNKEDVLVFLTDDDVLVFLTDEYVLVFLMDDDEDVLDFFKDVLDFLTEEELDLKID